MKITESQLRRIIREEVEQMNEMDPVTASAFGAVGSAMAGIDFAMITPALLVGAMAAAGMSQPAIDKALTWLKGKQKNAVFGRNEDIPPEVY